MPVDSKPDGVSPYGALDMAGNLWEWVADWYDSHYYAASPASNPQGAETGDYRVARGGSWLFGPQEVRSANRYGFGPDFSSGIGFRCVNSP